MPRPKKPELAASRDAFKALKPLPPYYGMRVADHFPEIDLQRLYKAVAGRIEYEDGLVALKWVKSKFPVKQAQAA